MKSRRRARLVVAMVVAALVLLVACGGGDSPSGEDAAPTPVEIAMVEIDGDPFGPSGESPDPAIGRQVPGLSGTAIDGTPLIWTPGERPTVMVFLAHWCPACQAEVAELTDWLDAGNELPPGVDFLSIVSLVNSERDNYPPSEWLAAEGWPFPVLVDSSGNEIAVALGQSGTPFWLFVNSDGSLAFRGSGQLHPDELAVLFDQLLARGEG